ncbi:ABC transporter permease [Prevotella sp. 10(H)]|uniref:ABC transporter permease n=1 Tax=Prevotella sp. 10(H) TaxID=1158294 RepID=UPI0004A7741E|nr:FtsX-like permease family protein [Prevotella sp. 10(H)]
MNLKHILKIIWTERYQNIWLLVELVIIFCILWFCSDYLFFMTKRAMEPLGLDIKHTYKVDIGIRNDAKHQFSDEEKLPLLYEDFNTLLDKIKSYEAVEDVCISNLSYPYTGAYSGNMVTVDTVSEHARIEIVSPEFFNVFRINFEKGKPFELNEKKVVISANSDGTFIGHPVNQVEIVSEGKEGEKTTFHVSGVANKVKRSEYQQAGRILYKPINKKSPGVFYSDICIRIKPGMDKNFVQEFTENMETRLDVGPFFLTSVTPMSDIRKEYLDWTGYANQLKSVYSVTTFLIINIFLGILGTFWFRMSSRRSEIGLRIALGASKANVRRMYICETVMILFIASIIGQIICLNIGATDLLKEIGVPVIDRSEEGLITIQSFINYGLTFSFLAIIAIIAVWFPAYAASRTQPVVALRYED